ncbi:hypothetical protein NEMBOFW57_004840 [Staphylotrichum longicolle]|uniref:Uncharacterized protein n=1 Tax=Staphylotrichum longicolle TaxID=669026 RepID=A0AAD4EZ99_9PEZI|nr:hypothetical protein NEMBOFW57_004840 [Staphylotrichum longicolle]
MSGIVNKIKEAVHGDKHHSEPEGTHGPHNTRTANAMDPRVDSDRDHSSTVGTGRTGTHTTGTHTGVGVAGYSTGTAEGTHGPHSSRVANAMDPRVDSDRDNSRTVGTGRTAGHGEFGSTGYGAGSTGYSTGSAEGTHGPHSSRVANAMDPRVDSDRDNSRTVGTGRTAGHGEFGSTGYGAGSTGYGTGSAEGTHGPHSSRIANAMDPRVDSDRDNSRTVGTGTGAGYGGATHHTGTAAGIGSGIGSSTHHTTGMTGTHGAPEGTYGPHSSRMANAADPRVDSDRDGRGAHGTHGVSGIGSGPGPAHNTAGPHKSDMANKLDPRVDSDLDGSKTMGGNRTYQSGNTSTYRDPTDAAQVPPSVLQKHVGGPVLEHEDHGHHRERRNSVKSHQETFRGI